MFRLLNLFTQPQNRQSKKPLQLWQIYEAVESITLPCGNSVFNTHSDTSEYSFQCELCFIEHTVPKQGFTVSKRIRDALDIEMDTLTFICLRRVKRDAKMAKENALDLQNITRNPESYLYYYELKRKVDLRLEWDFCLRLLSITGNRFWEIRYLFSVLIRCPCRQFSSGKILNNGQYIWL